MTKQELMFALLEEHEQSNLTIQAFCTARSLKVPRFHYWRRKLRASRSAPKGFIPILPAASTERASIRLAYPNGVSIHLPSADIAHSPTAPASLMFSLSSSHRFLLYGQPCDMRKSFDALCGVVRSELNRDPLSGEVFVFLNRGRTHLKLLHWESGGLVLYYKRLEKGTFAPPATCGNAHTINWTQLVLMVEGITVSKSTQKPRYNVDK